MAQNQLDHTTHIATTQLTAMSRLFSSTVIHEMARRGRSSLFARLARQSGLSDSLPRTEPVRAVFDTAFSILQRPGLRHEYIYKAAITKNILLGKHSLRTASVLTEFRVGQCKVDLAILNGTSTAYEIKSERDSLQRLDRQVTAYSKVFARVYVIAARNHVDAIMNSMSTDIGVLCLTNRHNISSLRDATDRSDRTSPRMIFESIRTSEARAILTHLGHSIPAVPNTQLRSALRDLFVALNPQDAHDGMVRTLRKTRNLLPLSDLVSELPSSLQAAALSVTLRKSDHLRLIAAVDAPLETAMCWD
jgi:glucuronate isomerase